MYLKDIKLVLQGHFIKRYDLHYTTREGKEKIYEVVTRKEVKCPRDLFDSKTDGVSIIVFNKDKTKILLNKEFRPAIDRIIYNFPAGLIEEGECAEESVKREMMEETGLSVHDIKFYGRAYTAVGISNETAALAICTADDTAPFGGNNNPVEEIEPVWVTKDIAKEIMLSGRCSTRVQMTMLMWTEDIFSNK